MRQSLSMLVWATAVMIPMPSGSCALMIYKSTGLTFLHLYPVTKSSALKRTCAKLRRSSKLKNRSKNPCLICYLLCSARKGAGIENGKVSSGKILQNEWICSVLRWRSVRTENILRFCSMAIVVVTQMSSVSETEAYWSKNINREVH